MLPVLAGWAALRAGLPVRRAYKSPRPGSMRVVGRDTEAISAHSPPHQPLPGDHWSICRCTGPIATLAVGPYPTSFYMLLMTHLPCVQDFMNNVCTNVLRLHQKKLIPYGGELIQGFVRPEEQGMALSIHAQSCAHSSHTSHIGHASCTWRHAHPSLHRPQLLTACCWRCFVLPCMHA